MRVFLYGLLLAMLFWSCSSPTSKENEEVELLRTEDTTITEEDVAPELNPPVGNLEKSLIDAGLVNIQDSIPGVLVELKYSTEDNFFGEDVYGDLVNCYLQPEVADMLAKAYGYLQEEHPEFTFLVYDGVRPLSVQQILWDNLDKPDSIKPLYVADPKKGSLHNFGVAVDLTLAFKNTGEALDMGTKYDYFGYPAYPDREDQMVKEGRITKEQVDNRKILRKVMLKSGFQGIGSEWWHFNAFTIKEAREKYHIVE